MSGPSSSQVLGLYRSLLRYGQTLQLTDRAYFYWRVRREFSKARTVESEERRRFLFEVAFQREGSDFCADSVAMLILIVFAVMEFNGAYKGRYTVHWKHLKPLFCYVLHATKFASVNKLFAQSNQTQCSCS